MFFYPRGTIAGFGGYCRTGTGIGQRRLLAGPGSALSANPFELDKMSRAEVKKIIQNSKTQKDLPTEVRDPEAQNLPSQTENVTSNTSSAISSAAHVDPRNVRGFGAVKVRDIFLWFCFCCSASLLILLFYGPVYIYNLYPDAKCT